MYVALSLSEWIERARSQLTKGSYVGCAVSMAVELTNHLRLVVGKANDGRACTQTNGGSDASHDSKPKSLLSEAEATDNISLSLVKLEDVVAENVMVIAATADAIANGGTSNHLVAKEVFIRPSRPSDLFDIVDAPQLLERDVCYALGEILFQVFSQGDPLVEVDLGPVGDEPDESSFADLLLERIDLGAVDRDVESKMPAPPAFKKKSSAVTSSPSNSSKAKAYLQEQGVPQSVCRLLHDLLEAKRGNPYVSNTALLSLEEALFDLRQMKLYPDRFLHECACPRKALELTSLLGQAEGELHGREEEMKILLSKAARVYYHAPPPSHAPGGQQQDAASMNGFLCEAVFLSGHSGSGKSRLVKEIASYCSANGWYVLSCKFDRQMDPLIALLRSVDAFFRMFLPIQDANGVPQARAPQIEEAFDRISRSIIFSVDGDSFSQLAEILPTLRILYPMSANYIQRRSMQNGIVNPFSTRHPSAIGSGSHRLKHLFDIILKALCSGGFPVAFILEDLQWIDSVRADAAALVLCI